MSTIVWGWLKRHKDEIGSSAAIIGVVVAAVGFFFTVWQLHITERTLRATNAYAIQSDSRALIERLYTDSDFRKFIQSPDRIEITPDFVYRLWEAFNFYLAVYRQDLASGIDDTFSASFKSDFCGFVRRPNVMAAWRQMMDNGQLSNEHEKMKRGWCDAT